MREQRPALVGLALRVFLRALFAHQRRAARARDIEGRGGAVTFVQHFGSALQLNVHLHIVVPDGVFDDDGTFHPLPEPSDADVARLLERTVLGLLRRLKDELCDDDAWDVDDALLSLQNKALAPLSPPLFAAPPPPKRLCARLEGFSLHAATRTAAWDSKGLLRLCHYGARGALANSRLRELPDGRFSYEMKRPLPNGRTHLVMTGVELLAKLTPLIPPPWANLTRYHGVFAPGSKLRRLVVPEPPQPPTEREAGEEPRRRETGTSLDVLPRAPRAPPLPAAAYRTAWADLLKRVFGTDVLACSRCGGRMKLIARIEEGKASRAILRHLGLPDAPLPHARSRAPPDDDLVA